MASVISQFTKVDSFEFKSLSAVNRLSLCVKYVSLSSSHTHFVNVYKRTRTQTEIRHMNTQTVDKKERELGGNGFYNAKSTRERRGVGGGAHILAQKIKGIPEYRQRQSRAHSCVSTLTVQTVPAQFQ